MTDLVARGSRFGPNVMLSVSVPLIAADAQINEFFQLPAGYGDVLIRRVVGAISTFSGAYVAPAPAYDGLHFYVTDSQGGTTYDFIGSGRFVHMGSAVTLNVSIECFERTLLRGSGTRERLYIQAPILGGAGVTVTVNCQIFGQRINTS